VIHLKDISQNNSDTVSLAAVGDIMLTRGVKQMYHNIGYDNILDNAISDLQKADIRFGNLENTLSRRGTTNPNACVPLKADPLAISCLKKANFTVVSLANNHIMDFGIIALKDTLKSLSSVGIRYVGAGYNLELARQPLILKKNGLTFIFLAYIGVSGATKNTAGPAPGKLQYIRQDIKKYKCSDNIIIVSIHWGIEFCLFPASIEISLGRKMIDFGADIVLGHHPHIFQPVERYKTGLIAYSLGNFVFDFKEPIRRETAILFCEFDKKSKKLQDFKLIPYYINDNFKPYPADEETASVFFRRLDKHCKLLSNDLDLIEEVNNIYFEQKIKSFRDRPLKAKFKFAISNWNNLPPGFLVNTLKFLLRNKLRRKSKLRIETKQKIIDVS